MRIRVVAGSLLLALLAATPVFAVDDAIVSARLNDVRTQPRTYLKSTFEFEGRFSNHGEVFQPFFTMFDDHLYTNFAAWDVDNNLANYHDYRNSSALLYLNRHSGEQMETLFHLTKYQRFRATGVVQSIFAGRAFIEVIDIVALDVHFLPESHAAAALAQGSGEIARNEPARPARDPVAQTEQPPVLATPAEQGGGILAASDPE